MTDGEFRRNIFFDGIFDKLEGTQEVQNPPEDIFTPYVMSNKLPVTLICKDKLRRTRPLLGDDFDSLKHIAGPEYVHSLKVTICTPEWFHFRHGKHTYDKGVYANDDLYSRGCRNIQIDDPILVFFCDENFGGKMRQADVDPEALLDYYIQILNKCLKDRPSDMTAGIHMCRGNSTNGRFFAQGGYDRIAIKLFNEVDVDCYYLEYDTMRAGGFEPLKYLPRNKTVVLGVVTTKEPDLEDPEMLRQRVLDAAGMVASGAAACTLAEALNQLCISPQCGFSSTSQGNVRVTDEDMKNKLSLVVRTAQMIWGQD
ncbi:Uncharacterized protein YxjG [Grifola frondosa]|uniref:Uncharacterized protein YxjG n=1 Tax=Grifola frondosa TaxID=5627 RepID=A0A1C7LXE1_GRIFR|nr:Uncharacterized protein YxjG [Grifola frondosa]